MMYLFFKRFIPVLFVGVIIYLILFVAYVGVFQVTSFVIDQKAHEIRAYSSNDADYVQNVKTWVWANVKYVDSYTVEIKPPEITYLVRRGDCSENSLLIVRMLNDAGITARPIYGSTGPEMHESVEYVINETTYRIDEEEFPQFVKHGNGIQSVEYVYDVYWFIPWRGDTDIIKKYEY
jgi:uncharacterized protein (UPF0333 family)